MKANSIIILKRPSTCAADEIEKLNELYFQKHTVLEVKTLIIYQYEFKLWKSNYFFELFFFIFLICFKIEYLLNIDFINIKNL